MQKSSALRDFTVQLWGPKHKKGMLKWVQRTVMIRGLGHLCYEKLRELWLLSLEKTLGRSHVALQYLQKAYKKCEEGLYHGF